MKTQALASSTAMPRSDTPDVLRTEGCGSNRVLFIGIAEDDRNIIRNLLGDSIWEMATVTNLQVALQRLRAEQFSVIFCESALEDGTWREVLNYTLKDVEIPLLVVMSYLVDDSLWAEVLNLGGYGVLEQPLNEGEIREVLTTTSLRLELSGHLTSSTIA